MNIVELLSYGVKNRASDLHIAAEIPPLMRVDGDLCRIEFEPLSAEVVATLLFEMMTTFQRHQFEKKLDLDFSFEVKDLARFRVNLFWQNRGVSGVFRIIPAKILSLNTLNMAYLKTITQYRHGLVLVTGPAGSGKSTTLAALVDEINTHKHHHIITIEDPIEFIYASQKSLINQREVHRHTLSFANALRASLREDPDVILVGELRDLETIRLALTAAETGHLVLATLHTSSAAKTVDRIITVFPAAEQAMIRTMLSASLRAVVSQRLVKKISGLGRLAAQEIMLSNTAIRNLIRENNIPQIYSVLQTNRNQGMQTLDMHLYQLVEQKLISWEEASTYINEADVLTAFRPK